MLQRVGHLGALTRRLHGHWRSAPALAQRAAALALVSGASLIAFAALTAAEAITLPGVYPALIQVALAAGVVAPAASLHFSRDRQEAKLWAEFADIRPPAARTETFPVPSLPEYRRAQRAPRRRGTILIAMALAAACAGPYASEAMIAAQTPLSILLLALLVEGAAIAVAAMAFVVAVGPELTMRARFHAEVVAGIGAAGYSLAGPFSAEDVATCDVLLREKDGGRYWSWILTFCGSTASMQWDEGKLRPNGTLWDEYDRMVRMGEEIRVGDGPGLASGPAV